MEATVSLTLSLRDSDQQNADYYIDPKTQTPSVSFLADVVDCLDGIVVQEIVSINGKTKEQLKAELQVQTSDL